MARLVRLINRLVIHAVTHHYVCPECGYVIHTDKFLLRCPQCGSMRIFDGGPGVT